MKIEIHDIPPAQWASFSENAHKVVFSEKRPWQMDRIDYAIVAIDADKRDPLSYVTVRELDSESVYWQYGGAFPTSANSLWAYKAYEKLVKWTKERYQRVTTLVESDNVKMLKMAMAVGFRVIGVRMFKGTVLCELLLEFKKEKSNG